MQHVFESTEPQTLYIEIGSGGIDVAAADVDRTVVELSGDSAEDVVVEQRGNQISVIGPQRSGFFSGRQDVRVRVTLPTGSDLITKVGSADVTGTGRLGGVQVTSGSGEARLERVDGVAMVKTGSGDIKVGAVGSHADLKTGSGDIEVERIEGQAKLSTGSGDILVGYAAQEIAMKSGTGDLRLGAAAKDAQLSTASGDLEVGRFERGSVNASTVSGDVRLGIPAGVPVWTDVLSTTGQVSSDLQGAGRPEDGQDYVEVRAKTVSGDVYLKQIAEEVGS